ncbi:hypothetical protein, partial [Sansalvadorimonas verongulae]|uniref:hypothetical protein n=1 Tax=Sansalvadorimonas verongulae TaxID=2172824 RepID=UPI001E5AABB2
MWMRLCLLIAGLGERLVASVMVTGKGLLPCMRALVFGELARCGERFVASALVTGKRPAPCVGALVPGE